MTGRDDTASTNGTAKGDSTLTDGNGALETPDSPNPGGLTGPEGLSCVPYSSSYASATGKDGSTTFWVSITPGGDGRLPGNDGTASAVCSSVVRGLH